MDMRELLRWSLRFVFLSAGIALFC